MKKATNKILSFLTAFAMVIGVLVAPFASANAAAPTKTEVNVWKLQPVSEDGEANPYFTEAIDHDGSKLEKDENGIYNIAGKQAKGLPGVEFTYWKLSASQLERVKNPKEGENNKTVEGVKAILNTVQGESVPNAVALSLTDNEGKTTVTLPNGYYWFVESKKPVDVTTKGDLAVPFELILPQVKLVKNDQGQLVEDPNGGYLTTLNIYPKNTVKTPKVDKAFKGETNVDDNQRNKGQRDYRLGEDVPYDIKTVIPANVKYGSVYWSDAVTEGLSLNKDSITIKIGEKTYDNNTISDVAKDIEWTTEENGRASGFTLRLNDAGLKLVNEQESETEILISYTAEVNEKSVVNIPESNDVTFHYGRTQKHGNTPVPNKPDNGKITVKKSWGKAQGTPVDPKEVSVQLYNANTGEAVGQPKTLTGPNYTAEWTGLDNRYEYKVVEITQGYDVVYGKDGVGVITLDNNDLGENPGPLTPSEPRVVHYGKRFVKADRGTNESLEGAQFVVKLDAFSSQTPGLEGKKGQYLARKSADQTNEDRQAYLKVRGVYEDMVAAGDTKYSQAQLNEYYTNNVVPAYNNLKTQYKWVDADPKPVESGDFNNTKDLVVLVSGKDGRFEIDGLPAGSYELLEVKAPEGYALPSNNETFKFNVNENSFTSEGDVQYEASESKIESVKSGTQAKRINNSNLTIPQTGGIGSLIFYVVGAAIVVGAIVAMKRRNSVEA